MKNEIKIGDEVSVAQYDDEKPYTVEVLDKTGPYFRGMVVECEGSRFCAGDVVTFPLSAVRG